MATSDQIISASEDGDLRKRIIALAAANGVEGPENWVSQQMYRLVSLDLDGSGPNPDSLASVYEYAVSQYTPEPTPGANPDFVTDALIVEAIQQLRASPPEGAA